MPIVECKQGNATTHVGGIPYTFERDKYGRFVCNVENMGHAHCFLSREDMYRAVKDPPDKDEKPFNAPPEPAQTLRRRGQREPVASATVGEGEDKKGAKDSDGGSGDAPPTTAGGEPVVSHAPGLAASIVNGPDPGALAPQPAPEPVLRAGVTVNDPGAAQPYVPPQSAPAPAAPAPEPVQTPEKKRATRAKKTADNAAN